MFSAEAADGEILYTNDQWRAFGLENGLGGIAATLLVLRQQDIERYALLGFGLLTLPLGLPALYEGYRRVTRTAT